MESGEGIDEKRRSLWKRYCKIGLLVAGVGMAVTGGVLIFLGETIMDRICIMLGKHPVEYPMMGNIIEPNLCEGGAEGGAEGGEVE